MHKNHGGRCILHQLELLDALQGHPMQNINVCGLKPHVCEHRCMNTHGSNKCHCLNRYMLMPDGTCSNSRTCTMVNCQYGCEEVKDYVRCLCPSRGLQLAPNEKTCIAKSCKITILSLLSAENVACDMNEVKAINFSCLSGSERQSLFLDITVVDCSFGRGSCAWQQDADDDFDWNPADHEFGDGYYMTVPAFIGHKGDVGCMKLLLTYLEPKSIYCLIFSYRLAGERVEQSMGNDERWWIGQIEVHTGAETAMNITFEAERGKGKTGETAVDAILLFSNLCSEDLVMLDI
ncbi:PREDICTED: signal peptide, CUB and EGF-like domain-containing protein 1 [Thamnophis sirtalis]|uniref:Signal peptide, CUB and EGF-like domain-containing protein 1 n=1 Tax=Thamnophis sirtalis TaxID=35019 RepID=A0A6I9YBS0_9SAUR|nr:PREDICTED: signal peptide, CUB and EGF-like domain-containing protein 1 [Thamnophis sirtalis]